MYPSNNRTGCTILAETQPVPSTKNSQKFSAHPLYHRRRNNKLAPGSMATDLQAIASALNVTLIHDYFSIKKVAGAYLPAEHVVFINTHPKLKPEYQHVTLGHELTHAVSVRLQAKRLPAARLGKCNVSEEETRADRIGRELTMPADRLLLAIGQIGLNVAGLCRAFSVTRKDMQTRLIDLGLLTAEACHV